MMTQGEALGLISVMQRKGWLVWEMAYRPTIKPDPYDCWLVQFVSREKLFAVSVKPFLPSITFVDLPDIDKIDGMLP